MDNEWGVVSQDGLDFYSEEQAYALVLEDPDFYQLWHRGVGIVSLCGDYPAPCNCDDPVLHNGH